MRLTVFLALMIVTFAAGIGSTVAENAAHLDSGRNLRAQQVGGIAAKADDVVASVTKRDEIAGNFIEVLRKRAMLTQATKAEEAGNLAKASVLKNTAGAISRLNKGEKEKISEMFTEVAKQDPKKWSKMRKVLVGTLGVAGGGATIYGVNKALTPDNTAGSS